MKSIIITVHFVIAMSFSMMAQYNDSVIIANIYENALTSMESYNNLEVLCDSAGPRLIGSKESLIAVGILKQQIESIGFDSLYLQDFESSVWKCNSPGKAIVSSERAGDYSLKVDVFGPSVPTAAEGINAGVVEVNGIPELELLDPEVINGKIVFYNTPMDNRYSNPLDAYVEARMLRFNGTSRAAEFGAKGVLMRSLTTSIDEFPHTGSIMYDEEYEKIPALAVSSQDSEILSELLSEDPNLRLSMKVDTEIIDSVKSYNVITEIKGKTNPEEVILIGAHIDSWHNSPGAHDDGAGCVQMIDVLRIFKALDIKNNKTIRVVLFMDEEINRAGAKAYADYFDDKKEEIIVGIESDLGAYSPNGFLIHGSDPVVRQIQAYREHLLPYGIYNIGKGFGGMDILTLKKKYGFPSIALRVESQRYFEIIHTENDTFDKVHQRELQLGTAAIASLVYLLDRYGLGTPPD